MDLEEVTQREKLRKFFEVDKKHIVVYTLSALANEQLLESKQAEKAIKKLLIKINFFQQSFKHAEEKAKYWRFKKIEY